MESNNKPTDQEITLEKVEESKKLLQNIFQHAPAAIAVFEGPEQIFALANSAYEKLINRKAEDLIGKTLREVLPELKKTGTFKLYDQVYKTGEPFNAPEYAVLADIKNDGVLRQCYFNISMEALKNDSGEVYGVLTMTYDITEQVLTRKKIEESEAFSRSILESSPDCVKVIDEEGRLQFMNVNGLCTMEIDDFSLFKNQPWSGLWGEENKHLVNGAIDKALAGNTASFQAFCPTAKGTPKWWDVMVSPVKSSGSDKTNSLISVSRDVTEQVNERKRIEESEAKYRHLFERMDQGFCIIEVIFDESNKGVDYRFLEINPVFENQTGLRNALGKTMKELVPDLEDKWPEMYGKVVITGIPSKFVDESESINRWFEVNAFRIGNAQDNKVAILFSDVSERKIKEKLIQQSEERFRLALASGKQTVFSQNKSLEYTWIHNPHAEFKATDVVGKTDEDLLVPSSAVILTAVKQKILYTGKPFDGDVEIEIAGQNVTYTMHLEPTKDADGNIAGIIGTALDISERIQAQKQIKDSEQRFRLSLAGNKQLVFSQDRNLIHTWIYNPHVDFKAEDIIGKSDEDLHVPSTATILTGIKQKVLDSGTAFIGDIEIEVNGQKLFYTMHIEAMLDIDGTVNGIIGNALDITERIKTQQKIKETEELLRKKTEQLELSITAGKIGIWHWDVKNDVLYWSKEQQAIYGLEPSAELLNIAKYRALVNPEDWERLNKDLQSEPMAEEQEYDFRINRKNDGALRWVKSRARNILDEEGALQFVSGVNIDITEQVIAFNNIQESEERFRSLAQTLPQLVWVNDANGNPEFASSRWKEYTGMEPGGDEEWRAIVHPDDYEGIVAAWLHSKATGNIYKYEVRLKSKEGKYRWHAGLGEAVLDKDKNIVKWVGAFTDIHEQKELSETLKESEKQFNTLANNIQNLAWMANGEGHIYWYNQRWYDYTGTTLEEMEGKGWEKVHHPEHVDRVVDFVKQAWQKNEPFELTFPLRAVDGKYRWFLTRVYPIADEGGKIINWIGTNTDITEQKTFAEQLEEQVEERTAELVKLNKTLTEQNEALSKSEAFNRSLTDVSPNVVYIHDVINNVPVFLNRAGLSIIGHTSEEALNNEHLQGIIIHPDDLPGVAAMVERVKQTNNDEIIEHEYRIKDDNGNWIPFLARDTVFKRNENNEVTHLLGIAVDISELKKVEKKLLYNNSELEKMNKELQSFAFISSHDLQEPLRKIQIFSNRIIELEENNLSDSGKDMFNRMQNSAKRMQTLIQDLLAYSRTTTEERKFKKTDLNTIVQELREDLKEELNDKQATIEAVALCKAHVIPFQFRQLLYNLIGNALKFSNPNVPPHITIRSEIALGYTFNHNKLSPNDNYCHITFSDNGIGFKQHYSEKIFEVFQRLHSRTEYQGTGIGLAIVKKIVDNHKGVITASGVENKGATFDIYIPA